MLVSLFLIGVFTSFLASHRRCSVSLLQVVRELKIGGWRACGEREEGLKVEAQKEIRGGHEIMKCLQGEEKVKK